MSDIYTMTSRLFIRRIEEEDRPLMLDIAREDPILADLIDSTFSDSLVNSYWKQITASNVTNGMIFRRDTKKFCGRICVTFEDDEMPELGITLLKMAQNQGIGPESIVAFCNWVYETTGTEKVKVRISHNNMHSQHIFEKLGAVYEGNRCFFSEKFIQSIRKINLDVDELKADTVRIYHLDLPVPCH